MTTDTLSDQSSKFSVDRKAGVWLYDLMAHGAIPEPLIRVGIRAMLGYKLNQLACTPDQELERTVRFVEELKTLPVAIATDKANQQHYELPPEFFELVLGPHRKYSCALWEEGTSNLRHAEEAMLELYIQRAGLTDGMSILELGCGWGSLSLYLAKRFPNSNILGVSNSSPQRGFIERQAAERGLNNLAIITADLTDFHIDAVFDRVISIEMFEHMKNYQTLLARIATWLKPEGKLFVHIFSHRRHQYHFDCGDPNDWLSRYFFSGGTMPSDALLLYFQDDLVVTNHWRVSGTHYQKTAEVWLSNMTRNRKPIMEILKATYGASQADRWWVYWRVFFLACSELWGYRSGTEWMVSHYLCQPRLR